MVAASLRVPAPGRRLRESFRYLAYAVVSIVMLLPFLWVIHTSLSSSGGVFAYPPSVVPHPTVFSNYKDAINGSQGIGTIWPFLRNTVLYAVFATLGCLIMQSIVGYGFARFEFPFKRTLFALTVATMMLPFVVTLIPRFLFFSKLHLVNTLWPLIGPWWFGGSPYGIFLMRQFFMSIPRDFDDAARIDGMGSWRILWTVLMPQAVPVLAALGIIEFTYFWNDLLGPLIYTQTTTWEPLSLGIWAEWTVAGQPLFPQFMATVAIIVIPLIVLFVVLQRRFRQGFLYAGLTGR